jgi:hypothetical protein
MNERELLIEAFDRLPELISGAVDGLTPAELHWAPARGANTIGWLVWHLTRIQDSHIAELLDEPQVWVTGKWAGRFDREPEPDDTGYGYSAADVTAIRPDGADALTGYYQATARQTHKLLDDVTKNRLDRIVDDNWDPPVTLGARLVSVLGDDMQHVGQAAYVRGMLRRR